ncbi:RNA polymerase sigma factor [Leyella lascolaii]|jgi:RNA polymerase sigma factor (sigma-70 family)|uniref:RNA polymerase sigma factor n=1 Tax=Leyella lascolaii TaxID=1776379 RepID=A0AAW7JM96_9BACT|nr:RNA polymerase sigma factor [Leyella lascolaii]MDN0022611.1 RNA polymerase sigma factor [Leyella lascolaii]MDN0025393.1 RNA polymerase sigma factor [Leyella lascolaii]CCZ15121.1 dNA-directed RNA polymerase sigma subunit RpoE [Prevotella sp. CAG:487]
MSKKDTNKTSENISDNLKKSFSDIVSQYSEPLYWKIRHIVLNHDDANDILQNVFIKAWKNIDDFQNRAKISTWLYRIAINESLDFIRKQKSTAVIESDADNNIANRLIADEYFDGDKTVAMLQQAIATLPEVQRVVFNLRYYDEMKYSEMSKILNTTEGALKASYHIAVKKITEYFKSQD